MHRTGCLHEPTLLSVRNKTVNVDIRLGRMSLIRLQKREWTFDTEHVYITFKYRTFTPASIKPWRPKTKEGKARDFKTCSK